MIEKQRGRVSGKIAVVTGAASGIGAETSRRLALEGASLVLTDVNVEAGLDVAEAIAARGGRAAFMEHDVTSERGWENVVANAVERFGRLDILVNNAGVGGSYELMSHSFEDWRRVLSINLDGVFLGLRHAGPTMAAGGGGAAINISSVMGKVGAPGLAAYCASKGGVSLLTKAAALEWAHYNIRVNSVHPGFIETAMVAKGLREAENSNTARDAIISNHALQRLGQPHEVADAVVFLASDEASFVTGSELVVDGGYTAQ